MNDCHEKHNYEHDGMYHLQLSTLLQLADVFVIFIR